jgi:hypothetical protein
VKWSPGGGKKKEKKPKAPTADDFTGGAIRKAVLSQTIQHPITLAPLLLSAGSALWFVLINPDFRVALVGFSSFLFGLCSWVVNFFIRGEELAKRHVENLRQLRENGFSYEIEDVGLEFAQAGFTKGAQAAKEITEAYTQLKEYLTEHGEDSAGGQRFLSLAYETHREGVGVLRKALHIFQALQRIDRAKLASELRQWEDELKYAAGEETESLKRRIEGHHKRIERYDGREQELRRLLDQCEELEGALESAYIDVVGLVGDMDTDLLGGSAAQRLEQAVETARRVEDRLRGIEDPQAEEEDEMYYQAGKLE